MSVQSEITRLATAKAAIKSAIESKGVTVSETTMLDGMAALIDTIEAGGDTTVEDALITRTISGEYTNSRVTKVSSYAFYSCSSLASVDLSRAMNIGNYAFQSCSSLASVDLSRATKIGNYAFYSCSKLTTLVLRNTTTVCSLTNTNAFNNTPIKNGTGYIYVPDDLVDSYKAATNWSAYAAQIKPLSEYTGG